MTDFKVKGNKNAVFALRTSKGKTHLKGGQVYSDEQLKLSIEEIKKQLGENIEIITPAVEKNEANLSRV